MIKISIISIIALAFIVMAVLILSGKGDGMIAGYNTASEEERAQVNVKRLRLVLANVLILTAVAIPMPVLMGRQNDVRLHLCMGGGIMVITLVAVILANTWCRKK